MMSPALLNQVDPLRDPFPINRVTRASSADRVRNIWGSSLDYRQPGSHTLPLAFSGRG